MTKDHITPQQADREAAGKLLLIFGMAMNPPGEMPIGILAGACDDWATVQAFAHHAQQARLEERESKDAIELAIIQKADLWLAQQYGLRPLVADIDRIRAISHGE